MADRTALVAALFARLLIGAGYGRSPAMAFAAQLSAVAKHWGGAEAMFDDGFGIDAASMQRFVNALVTPTDRPFDRSVGS